MKHLTTIAVLFVCLSGCKSKAKEYTKEAVHHEGYFMPSDTLVPGKLRSETVRGYVTKGFIDSVASGKYKIQYYSKIKLYE